MFLKLKSRLKTRYKKDLDDLMYGGDVIVYIASLYLQRFNKNELSILDIGLGQGIGLLNIKKIVKGYNKEINTNLFGLERYLPYAQKANKNGIKTIDINIEKDDIPLQDTSLDIIILNQVLQYIKEWYFMFRKINIFLETDFYRGSDK